MRFPIIFTTRGLILLILAVYLLGFPVKNDHDIFATVIGLALLITVLFLGILNLIFSIIHKKNQNISLLAGDNLIAKEKSTLFLSLNNFTLPPFLSKSLTFVFNDTDFKIDTFSIASVNKDNEKIFFETVFPNRGAYKIKNMITSIKDAFGLTLINWSTTLDSDSQNFSVSPQKCDVSNFPLQASYSTAGDDLQDNTSKVGDPYDLKTYHPSDGIRKIAWKIYARSGQLVSRHPEPTFTPDGEAIVFLIANAVHDITAQSCLYYLNVLAEKNITFSFLVSGSSNITKDLNSASLETIDSALKSNLDNLNSNINVCMTNITDSLKDQTSKANIIIFIPDSLCSEFDKIKTNFINKQILNPIFYVVKDTPENSHTTKTGIFLNTKNEAQKTDLKNFMHEIEDLGWSYITEPTTQQILK